MHSDDKILKSLEPFIGKEVVVTEKRDGENTSLYHNGSIHARSLTGTSHAWQDVIKAMWAERCRDLPEGWRVVGENLYAQHSIRYENLKQWIEVLAIFDEQTVLVGSLNLDARSFYLNTEIALLLQGESLAHAMTDWLAGLLAEPQSWPLTLL